MLLLLITAACTTTTTPASAGTAYSGWLCSHHDFGWLDEAEDDCELADSRPTDTPTCNRHDFGLCRC